MKKHGLSNYGYNFKLFMVMGLVCLVPPRQSFSETCTTQTGGGGRPVLGPVSVSTGQVTFSGGLGSPSFCRIPGQSAQITLEQLAQHFGEDAVKLSQKTMTDAQFQAKWGTAGRTLINRYPNTLFGAQGLAQYSSSIQSKALSYFSSIAKQDALRKASLAPFCAITKCNTCATAGLNSVGSRTVGTVASRVAGPALAKSAGIVLGGVGIVLSAPFSALADVFCNPTVMGNSEIRFNPGNYSADLKCEEFVCSPKINFQIAGCTLVSSTTTKACFTCSESRKLGTVTPNCSRQGTRGTVFTIPNFWNGAGRASRVTVTGSVDDTLLINGIDQFPGCHGTKSVSYSGSITDYQKLTLQAKDLQFGTLAANLKVCVEAAGAFR